MPRDVTRSSPAPAAEERRTAHAPAEKAWPHHALLLLFTLLWGSNFVLAEVALFEMAPISFSVSRFVMGGVGMLGVLYFQYQRAVRQDGVRRSFFPPLARSDWPRLALISVLGATLAPWLGIEGLGQTSAGRAAFWLALAPVVSAGMGYAMRTERLKPLGRIGLVLAALGTLGLAADGLVPGRGYWLGDLMLLAALLLAVAELHLIKPLAARYGAAPMVAARTVLGGALYLLVATPSLAEQPWLRLGTWTWIAILAGGVVGVGLGQWVKVRALRAIGPTQVVIYGNMVPLATLVVAWLTIGTPSSLLEVGAGLLIVAGALCLQAGGGPILTREPPEF